MVTTNFSENIAEPVLKFTSNQFSYFSNVRNAKERSVESKIRLLRRAENFPIKNNRVKEFLLITNKWDEWTIYDHIARFYTSLFT